MWYVQSFGFCCMFSVDFDLNSPYTTIGGKTQPAKYIYNNNNNDDHKRQSVKRDATFPYIFAKNLTELNAENTYTIRKSRELHMWSSV